MPSHNALYYAIEMRWCNFGYESYLTGRFELQMQRSANLEVMRGVDSVLISPKSKDSSAGKNLTGNNLF